jgi:uncharacterized iron-regulated membrane protein
LECSYSNKTTGTTGPTDGQTGGDKYSNEMTGTARPTDGETVFDKHSNKMTGTTGPTGVLFQSVYWGAYHLQFDHQ